MILENPSADGPFGAKAIGEMANNAQPPAITAAIHDAVGVWVTEMPATPERVLRASRPRPAAPRGKRVIFDEESRSRRSAPTAARAFWGSMPERVAPFRTGTGASLRVPDVTPQAIGGEQVLLCRARYEPGKQVPRHAHEQRSQQET